MAVATHVIIRGHVFTYEEKQPFVTSGKSVLGALEYNTAEDETKCHECGRWFSGLGWHVTKSHGMTTREYKKLHGLRESSALCGMRIRRSSADSAKKLMVPGKGILSLPRLRAPRPKAKSQEWHNENSRCNAQLLFRIQIVAATVGHTPTRADLLEHGICQTTLVRSFGSLDKVMRLAGLESNHSGKSSPLPRAFPSLPEIKKRWNERMPWPADYFTTPPKSATPLSGR